MIKTILAAVVAGAFLSSVPVRADDKATAPAADKADHAKKAKKEKKDDSKKEEKAAGGGW